MHKRGFIYIVNQPGTSSYKIGFTKTPKRRILDMRVANPFLTIHDIYIGTQADERALHKIYSDFRISREWFTLSLNQIEDIRLFFMEKYLPNAEAYLNIYSKAVADLSNATVQPYPGVYAVLYGRGAKEVSPEKKRAIILSEETEITDDEYADIVRINLSVKAVKAVKYFWLLDKLVNTVEMCRKTGLSESSCQKALAILRRHEK